MKAPVDYSLSLSLSLCTGYEITGVINDRRAEGGGGQELEHHAMYTHTIHRTAYWFTCNKSNTFIK